MSKKWDDQRNGMIKEMGWSKEWDYQRNGMVKQMECLNV